MTNCTKLIAWDGSDAHALYIESRTEKDAHALYMKKDKSARALIAIKTRSTQNSRQEPVASKQRLNQAPHPSLAASSHITRQISFGSSMAHQRDSRRNSPRTPSYAFLC